MKTQLNNGHHGVIDMSVRPHMQQERLLAPRQQAALEQAQGPGEIRWAVRKEKVQPAMPANRFGRRLSLGETRTFASVAEQRAYWVSLFR